MVNQKIFTKAISNYKNDETLLNWIAYLNGMSLNDVKKMTPKEINNGFCEDYAAFYFCIYGADVYLIKGEHFVLKVKDKYYDTWNPEGVYKLNDLNFFKNRTKKYTEEQLQSMLKKENPLNYEIYKENLPRLGHTINMYQELYN